MKTGLSPLTEKENKSYSIILIVFVSIVALGIINFIQASQIDNLKSRMTQVTEILEDNAHIDSVQTEILRELIGTFERR